MAEYIEREALFGAIGQRHEIDGNHRAAQILECILEAPAADVAPVVRCVECAKAIPHKYSPHFYKCGGCSYLRGRLVGRLFGCTAGKRKDGGEEDAV